MWDAFWNNEWFPGETENGQRFRDCESKNIEANLASTMEGGNRLEVGEGISGHNHSPVKDRAQTGDGPIWRLSAFIHQTNTFWEVPGAIGPNGE